MPKIKISKRALRKGGSLSNDWRAEFNKKNLAKLNKVGGSLAKDKIEKILEIERMAPKERYNALVKLDTENTIKSQKTLIFRLKAALSSVISLLTILLVVVVVYVVTNIVYKKYIEKDEKYKTWNPTDLLILSYNDLIPNLKSIWEYLKQLIKPTKKEIKIVRNKEVFNISKNDYTYPQAKKLCKALGCKLATRDQVKGAYNKGAEWCNYGWTEGQYALYPTQKKTYDMLVAAGKGDECGKPGINGGYFSDATMKFGVNCYGVKPDPDNNNIKSIGCDNPKITQTINKETGKYEMTYLCPTKPTDGNGGNGDDDDNEIDLNTIEVLPFSNYKWSIKSAGSNLYIGDNSISRNINDDINDELNAPPEKKEDDKKETDSKTDKMPVIGKQSLKNALTEIDNMFSSSALVQDLKSKFGKTNKTPEQMWKMVASYILVDMKSKFNKYGINTADKKSGKNIEDAVTFYNDTIINGLKSRVDKNVTRAGIQSIVNRLKN